MSITPTIQFVLNVLAGRPEVPQGVEWSRATETLHRHRLAGMAYALVGKDESVPADQRESWEGAFRKQAVVGQAILEAAKDALALLAEQGITGCLFKGAALVDEGLYRSAGERAFSDADVLVPPAHANQAVDTLLEHGYAAWDPSVQQTVGWADAANFVLRGDGGRVGGALDLHWRLDYGSLRYGRESDVLGSGDLVERGCDRITPELHLCICLEHVLKHLRFRIHLPGLSDAIRLCGHVDDWEKVHAWFGESPWGRGCRGLLMNLHSISGCLPEDQVSRVDGTGLPKDLLALDRLVSRVRIGVTPWGGLLTRWRITGLGAIVSDVADTTFPPTSWLRVRYGTETSPRPSLWARHMGRLVAWLVGVKPSPFSPNQDHPPRSP